MSKAYKDDNTDIKALNRAFATVFDSTMHLLVECDKEQAAEFARKIGEYNNFDPDKIAVMLNRWDAVIPRRRYQQDDNPNNGELAWKVRIGREHSPVVYLDVYSGGGVALEELPDDVLIAIGQAAYADEADLDKATFMLKSFRFWWD